jgi:hypothetical protein
MRQIFIRHYERCNVLLNDVTHSWLDRLTLDSYDVLRAYSTHLRIVTETVTVDLFAKPSCERKPQRSSPTMHPCANGIHGKRSAPQSHKQSNTIQLPDIALEITLVSIVPPGYLMRCVASVLNLTFKEVSSSSGRSRQETCLVLSVIYDKKCSVLPFLLPQTIHTILSSQN